MRKTARKQKKLEKLRKQYSSTYSAKLEESTAMDIPKTTQTLVLGTAKTTSWESDERLLLSVKDIGNFAKGIAYNTTVKSITCPCEEQWIDYLADALKINTSVETLRLAYAATDASSDSKCLNHIAEIIQYSNITSFFFSDFQQILPDGFEPVISALQNNTKLTSLSIPASNYTPQQFEAFVRAINLHPNITNLTVHPGLEGQHEMELIGDIIKENKIKKIHIQRSRIWRRELLTPILKAFKENSSITDLSLALRQYRNNECQITSVEVELLAETLRHNQTLTKLDITGNKFGSDLIAIVLDSLHHNKTLTQLDFWDNRLTGAIQPTVAALLNVNESLTEIDLSQANIHPNLLGPALKNNKSITSLSLFLNNVGASGCKFLAEGLKFDKTLIRLNLKECKVDDEGCRYLSKAIKTNQCLLHLDISGQDIKVEGYKALIEGLKKNDSLTDLVLSRDKFVPYEMHQEILDLQDKNKRCRQDLIIKAITMLIQIARSDAFDMFPLEIWLRIFKHFVCGGVPGFNHIAETILMHSDVMDLTSLCKMRIVRINGKSHLVQKTTN